jgi:hypothetical protein
MTDAQIGYGTTFSTLYPDSPNEYVALAEVTSVSWPNMARDSVDASHMESPNRYREFIPGMVDPGEMSVEFNFIPGNTSHHNLLMELELPETLSRRIVKGARTFEFRAFLTGLEMSAAVGDKQTGTATFKLTGEPVGMS